MNYWSCSMKNLLPFFVFVSIVFVLMLPRQSVMGAAEKEDLLPEKPDAPVAITSTPTPLATAVPDSTATPPPNTQLACLRINFEVSGDVALAGTYSVKEVGGRPLANWEAQAGWQDSGWIRDIDISYEAVHVKVLYQAADGSDPVEMIIVNPAPNSEYGWVARGMCHALEVAWPK